MRVGSESFIFDSRRMSGMVKNRKHNLFIGIILALTCFIATASAFMVYAEGESASTIDQINALYEQSNADVVKSDLFCEGEEKTAYADLYTDAKSAAAADDEIGQEYYLLMTRIVTLAECRNEMLDNAAALDNDAVVFNGIVERESVPAAKKVVQDFLKDFYIKGSCNPSVFGIDKLKEYEDKYVAVNFAIAGIVETDKTEFEDLRNQTAKNIGEEYESLTLKTTSGDVKGDRVFGSYSSEQLEKLNNVLANYVIKTDGEEGIEYVPSNVLQTSVVYDAETVVEKRAELKNIENTAKKKLGLVPHNVFEAVYAEYNDYQNQRIIAEESEDEEEKAAAAEKSDAMLSALKANDWSRVNQALSFYDGASDEIKLKYSERAKTLRDFIADPPKPIITQYVSSLTDEHNVVTITAYFVEKENGQLVEAKVFALPEEGGKLSVYENANGANKLNANTLLRESNKNLSVAYFISLEVYNGYKKIEKAPLTANKRNADGSKAYDPVTGEEIVGDVYYRVEINLADYFEKYCKPRGYESNKLSNVEMAYTFLKTGEGALCYNYAKIDGKIEKTYSTDSLQTELDGGTLVFYTRNFNDFCVAGTGLETLFTNPWFWIGAIVLLIVLILVIKAIVKNHRFAIKFVVNGGTPVRTLRVAKGEAIVLPDAPEKTGLVFAGWYVDPDCTTRFIETKLRRRKGFKLYAKWAAPVSAETLTAYYDSMRTLMMSYEKRSFKPTLGLIEKELIANLFGEDNYLVLYLAIKPTKAKELVPAANVLTHKDKKFASLPTKLVVSDECSYISALALIKATMVEKGLQLKDELPETCVSTAEERAAGFAYYIKNERVAANMADYFELLRISLKSYILENDNGTFKPGDRFTFARIYYTAKNVDLYMPIVKTVKDLEKGERQPRFADTPVHIVICDNGDLEKAYDIIEKAMLAYGFTKYPENTNDLEDIVLSDTDGFAYTIRF